MRHRTTDPIRRRAPAPLIVLALIAAACSGGVAEPGSGDPGTSGPANPSDSAAPADDTHYRWVVGDCILPEAAGDLPYEPFGRATVVDCSEPHAYEVYFTGDHDEGPEDPFPDDLGERSWEACAAAFKDYIGVHVSQSGLDIVVYQPDRAEWAGGLRYQACVVQDPSAGGETPLTIGSLRGIGDAAPFTAEAGDCFATGDVRGPGLECSSPHQAEVIGFLTHQENAGGYPGAAAFRDEADTGCVDLLAGYAGPGATAIPASPVTFARLLSEAEWNDGLRTVPCIALVFDSDRRHLMVVGSLADPDWWVIGAGQAA